jgi:hypothetical protein
MGGSSEAGAESGTAGIDGGIGGAALSLCDGMVGAAGSGRFLGTSRTVTRNGGRFSRSTSTCIHWF